MTSKHGTIRTCHHCFAIRFYQYQRLEGSSSFYLQMYSQVNIDWSILKQIYKYIYIYVYKLSIQVYILGFWYRLCWQLPSHRHQLRWWGSTFYWWSNEMRLCFFSRNFEASAAVVGLNTNWHGRRCHWGTEARASPDFKARRHAMERASSDFGRCFQQRPKSEEKKLRKT